MKYAISVARDPVERPRDAVDRPRDAIEQARDAIEQARDAVEQARDAVERARDAVERPRDAVERPRDAIENLSTRSLLHSIESLARSMALDFFNLTCFCFNSHFQSRKKIIIFVEIVFKRNLN